MRILLALILLWLTPAQGVRRAGSEQASTAGVEPDVPVRLLIDARRPPRLPEFVRGEDVALVRPYVTDYERTPCPYCLQGAAA